MRYAMQLKTPSPDIAYQPLNVVGSSTFGINPKIISDRTFNMIMSDGWMVNYAGYRKEIIIQEKGEGRFIFTSIKSGALISVISDSVYSTTLYSVNGSGKKKYSTKKIGTIETISGDVFIDENNLGQIGICDKVNIYIYNYITDVFMKAVLPEGIIPGYITYQNGRFITVDLKSNRWYVSSISDGLDWFPGNSGEPLFSAMQTKPDYGKVAIRFPGRGNLLLLQGENVSELWTDVGGSIFPYQKNTSVNFDYGCISSATVATSEKFVAWLGTNERSESVIMFSDGSDVQTITEDGINNKLQAIINPRKSVGFFVKIYGHLIYQLTFYDKRDNYSLLYDFTTQKFFDVTDENQNYHIARHVAFYTDEYYFVSLNDGCIYVISSDLPTYDYGSLNFDIPRIRVCANFRYPNSKRFVLSNVVINMQQGEDPNNMIPLDNYNPTIDLSISRDGGISFGSSVSQPLNPLGQRQNIVRWDKLGAANDMVLKFRFNAKTQWNTFDGVMGIRQ
jgi:hypothetical protein